MTKAVPLPKACPSSLNSAKCEAASRPIPTLFASAYAQNIRNSYCTYCTLWYYATQHN